MCLVGFWAKLADEAGLEPKITAMFSVIHQTSYAVSKYTYRVYKVPLMQFSLDGFHKQVFILIFISMITLKRFFCVCVLFEETLISV